MLEEEFGGPKKEKFSELVTRNTYNKICSLANFKIDFIDNVNPEWSLLTIDLSKNLLKKEIQSLNLFFEAL